MINWKSKSVNWRINWKIKSWLGLKTDKTRWDKSISSAEEKKNKKGGITFQVGGNYGIKKSTIENPKLSGELNVPVLNANKKGPGPSIEKQKAKFKS
jgi:hypothetical protein